MSVKKGVLFRQITEGRSEFDKVTTVISLTVVFIPVFESFVQTFGHSKNHY